MELTFRMAREQDVSLLLDFIKGLAAYEKRPQDVTATVQAVREAVFQRKRAEAFFIVENGNEIGYGIYYYIFSSFAAACGLYVEDLFIVPEKRGRGYGRAALGWLAEKALKEGCGGMEWSCLDWNTPAMGFYEKLGARLKKGSVRFLMEKESMEALAGSGNGGPSVI